VTLFCSHEFVLLILTRGYHKDSVASKLRIFSDMRSLHVNNCNICFRLREERGEAERALALDHKVRDLSSHNGK
jgi:hypothetical protein